MRVSKEVNPPGEDPSKGAKTVSVRAKTEEHMEQLRLPHHHGAEAQIPALCRELEKTEKFQTIADVFRQLGDPTRVRIFWLLCHCEPCVVNISAMMDMSSPAISHHLRALKASGLIVSRREGKEVYYRAADTAQARLLHQMIERVMEIACPEEEPHHGA